MQPKIKMATDCLRSVNINWEQILATQIPTATELVMEKKLRRELMGTSRIHCCPIPMAMDCRMELKSRSVQIRRIRRVQITRLRSQESQSVLDVPLSCTT